MNSGFRFATVTLIAALITGCSTTPQKSSGAVQVSDDNTSNVTQIESRGVRVRGIGTTCDDALRNGFVMAAQQKIGSVVSSSRDIINSHLSLDEILDYSSGYVERYVIHSRNTVSDQCMVDMTVWVLDSRIARRIVGHTRGSERIDGQLVAASYDSFKRSVDSADNLLKSVLRDFPQRSFVINQSNYRVKFDANREPVLEIPYVISWNRNYLDALKETLHYASINKEKVSGKPYDPRVDNKLGRDYMNNYSPNEYHGRVIIDPNDYFIGSIFYIPDVEHFHIISRAFSYGRRPMLAISYYDHRGQPMREKMFCADFDSKLNFIRARSNNTKRLELETQNSVNYVFSVWLDEYTIRNLTRVELSVMAAEDCSVVAKR